MVVVDLSDVTALLDGVHAIRVAHEAAMGHLARRFAPAFSPFEFIDIREMKVSQIIAWLLDPGASHGQRGLFLEKFLTVLEFNETDANTEKASVRCEESTSTGRFDIFIELTAAMIIVENKIGAPDGNEQLEKYFRYLDGYKKHKIMLVYLTSDGRKPNFQSLNQRELTKRCDAGQLRMISYSEHISRWLIECARDCLASRPREFIDAFLRQIETKITGKTDPTMKDLLITDMIKSPEKVASAFAVAGLIDNLKASLFVKLRDDLAADTGTVPRIVGEPGEQYYKISIPCPNPGLNFVMQFDGQRYNDFAWGVTCEEEGQVSRFVIERQKLLEHIGPSNYDDARSWLWCREKGALGPIARHWRDNVATWAAIADRSLAAEFAKHYRDVAKALEATSPLPASSPDR